MQMWAVLNMRAVRANFIARLYPSATVASILQLQVIINDEEQQRYQVASCLYERDALLEEDNSAENDLRQIEWPLQHVNPRYIGRPQSSVRTIAFLLMANSLSITTLVR